MDIFMKINLYSIFICYNKKEPIFDYIINWLIETVEYIQHAIIGLKLNDDAKLGIQFGH